MKTKIMFERMKFIEFQIIKLPVILTPAKLWKSIIALLHVLSSNNPPLAGFLAVGGKYPNCDK